MPRPVALIIALPAVTAVLMGGGTVRADCISDCLAAQDCSLSYSGACSNALSSCSQRCVGGGESSGGGYGAIAYDRTSGAYGYAFQYPDETSAGDFALSKCAEHGEGCAVIVTFENACAALAIGKKEGAPASYTHVSASEEVAKSKAIADCTAGGLADCEVQVWSCSFQ